MSNSVIKALIANLSEEIIKLCDIYETDTTVIKQYRILLRGDEDEDKIEQMIEVFTQAVYNIFVHQFTELDLYKDSKEGVAVLADSFMSFMKEDINNIFRGTHEHSIYLLKGHDMDHVPLFELPFICSLNLIFTYRKDKIAFQDIAIDYGVEIMKRNNDTFFILNEEEGKPVTLN